MAPLLLRRGVPVATQNLDSLLARPTTARVQSRRRVVVTLACAALLLTVVGGVFWYQDYRYSLPTPRPPALADVNLGTAIALPASVPAAANDRRPLWLHFFNPDCPCTRFNAEHVRSLRTRFGAQVRFVAVVQTDATPEAANRQATLATAARWFGPGLEAVFDDGGTIAASCGVYSTPQAVILTTGPARTLLFRGNYNASRYCADPQTEFVRLALAAVVDHAPLPAKSRAAMIAYGCELPANLAAAKGKL